MIRPYVQQQGQAVIEALLMLPLMALLIWAVAGIGSLQFSALHTTQASRKAVMSSALGQPLQALRAPGGMNLSNAVTALSGVATPRVAALQDEWFGAGLRMLSVETRTRSPAQNPTAWPSIARRISVASGGGHAHGDADVLRRMGSSRTAWQQPSQYSSSAAARMEQPVGRADGAWGRSKLSLDWLSAWADVVPADRLGNREKQTR